MLEEDDDIASYWEDLRAPKEEGVSHQFTRTFAANCLQRTPLYLGLFDERLNELDIPRELLYLGDDGVNTASLTFQSISRECVVSHCGLFTTPDKREGPLNYVPLPQPLFFSPGVIACFASGSFVSGGAAFQPRIV